VHVAQSHWKCAAENVAFFLLPEPLCDPKICLKCVCGRGGPRWGSSRRSPRPSTRLGRGIPPPHTPSPSAPPTAPRLSRLRRSLLGACGASILAPLVLAYRRPPTVFLTKGGGPITLSSLGPRKNLIRQWSPYSSNLSWDNSDWSFGWGCEPPILRRRRT